MYTEQINKLLCQLLQVPLPAESLTERLAGLSPAEWELLLAAAHRHKVLPILYQQLGALPHAVGVPQDIQEQVRRAYLKTLVINRKLLRDLRQILLAFKARGLDVIVLKGAYLLEHAYANIGLRGMSDVDLLVRQADLPAAIASLQDLGCHIGGHFDLIEDNRGLRHMPMISGNGLYLEVHQSLSEKTNPVQIDLAGIWRRAVIARIASVDALAMCPEDLILHLCTHATYQHAFLFGLRPLVDLQQVLLTHQVNWDQLVQTAQAWGIERVIGLTLHLMEQILAWPVPPGVQAALLTEPIDQAVIDNALAALFFQPDMVPMFKSLEATRFYTTHGIRNKLGIVLRSLLLPKASLARMYGVSERSWLVYAYYPVRFFHILTNHSISFLGLLKKGQTTLAKRQAAINLLNHQIMCDDIKQWMAKK